MLSAVAPFAPQRPLVLGAGGQVGRALRTAFPTGTFLSRDDYDLADPAAPDRVDWDEHDVVVNAAAYTAVDAAETPEGRRAAWAANVDGVRRLAEAVRRERKTLVHFSSDYVFDGTREQPRRGRAAQPRSASTARPRPPATRSSPTCPAPTSSGRAG